MNLANLMKLSEASGFTGGSGNFVDAYPEMSLVECQLAMSTFITESSVELLDGTRKYNESILECITNSLASGTTLDESAAQTINEGAWDSIKSYVSSFFAKVKKFIDTIIAKVKVFIDKIVMDGKQLVQKYGNDPDFTKNADKLDDLTFDGFKFTTPKFTTDVNPADLITSAYNNDAVKTPNAAFSDIRFTKGRDKEQSADDYRDKYVSAAEEAIDSLSSKERKSNMATKLTGVSNLGDNWESTLREQMYEKHSFTYGSDGFDLGSVKDALLKPESLTAIRSMYLKLKTDVEKYQKELTAIIDRLEKDADKANNKADSAYAAYLKKFLAAYNDAINVINSVGTIRMSLEQNRMNQNKKMFSKMLSAVKKGFKSGDDKDKKKSDNNDVDVDDEVLFDIE